MLLPDKGSYQEEEQLKRLAGGDEKAFNTIYQRYSSILFNAAMVYVKDTGTAQDIVQQVFLKIWEKRAGAVGIDSFHYYLIVTSRNLIYDRFRKTNVEVRKIAELARQEANNFAGTGADLAEEREHARIFETAISTLPPQQRKIYLLIQEEQLSYKETAVALGLSMFTVKKHLELARRSVRRYVMCRQC